MKFVHLHVHTHYSLLDGLTKIDELVGEAKQEGAPAVAITDHGVMYGVIEFYQKCLKAEIKPIIGVETYLAPGSRFDKITKEHEKTNYHILLLAKNNQGYKNLIALTTIAHLEGFYYKPRIDWETLVKYHEGLICSSACLAGEIPTLIRAGKTDRARQRIEEYRDLFGEGNYYLELMHHPELPELPPVNEQLIGFSRELGVPLVATNDVHYLHRDDDEAQDILLCLQNKKKKEDSDRLNMTGADFSFRSMRSMIDAFKDTPDAIDNTVKIAEQCNVEIELEKIQLPYFSVPDKTSGNEYLRHLCEEGLKKRYNTEYAVARQDLKERMDYELSVIEGMGWPSYFLIVSDFVNWAKENGIVVGPGRGSAAGSLVCYLTGITNIDPMKYGLLFERFLNPDRISMPDIDLDFADIRRDEVIRYVEDKYGKDHVAQIITFGTMAARAAVRDVGRVLGASYDYCDRLAKLIPMFVKLDEAVKTVPELSQIYRQEEEAKRIIDFARRLEGVARHASTHACGVLITKEPLTEHVPIQYASSSDRTIVSQYSLHPVEDLGLLKMDFLGLKNLTIIESAIRIIKNTRGLPILIDSIPLDDQKTFELFKKGETTGVFQFESSGMRRYLKELKPTEFEDIIAMVALYRPGPMEWIPDYISGKHGHKKPVYLHPKLEPILNKTYGVAIYQEQVMQMARDLAGFTMAQADVLRKAVGKKIAKLLAEQKEKFVTGCVKNGISSQLAEKIFSFIEPFAGYGFNRSHAACYALIAYQTAYLKSHWPTEFMAALLTADQQNIDRLAVEIEECRRMGIEVKSPDVNQSYESFTVVTTGTEQNQVAGQDETIDTVRFGLHAIKNIGEHIAEVLIAERKQNGPYSSLSDLLERITDKDLNKKSLESLIKSGSLDQFGERGQLLFNMENILAYNKESALHKTNGQTSLFADAPQAGLKHDITLAPHQPIDRQAKLSWEKELMGLYISEHPFADFKKHVESLTVPLRELSRLGDNQEVTVAGTITKIKKILTRTGKSMVFVKIEDDTSGTELLVFPKVLESTAAIWEDGRTVICLGKISDKDRERKVIVNNAQSLTLEGAESQVGEFARQAKNNGHTGGYGQMSRYQMKKDLKLHFIRQLDASALGLLKQILEKYPGRDKVIFVIKSASGEQIMETEYFVGNNAFLNQEIRSKMGNYVVISDK